MGTCASKESTLDFVKFESLIVGKLVGFCQGFIEMGRLSMSRIYPVAVSHYSSPFLCFPMVSLALVDLVSAQVLYFHLVLLG